MEEERDITNGMAEEDVGVGGIADMEDGERRVACLRNVCVDRSIFRVDFLCRIENRFLGLVESNSTDFIVAIDDQSITESI